MCDPEGLIPVPLLFLAGKALALGLGLGGAYAAASATDIIGNHYSSGSDIRIPPSKRKNISAVDAVTTVAPMVADIHHVAQLPGSLALNIATGTLPAFLRNQTLMQFATKGIGDSHQLEE